MELFKKKRWECLCQIWHLNCVRVLILWLFLCSFILLVEHCYIVMFSGKMQDVGKTSSQRIASRPSGTFG